MSHESKLEDPDRGLSFTNNFLREEERYTRRYVRSLRAAKIPRAR